MANERCVLSIGSAEIELLVGDITKIPVDAIVNAANSALAGGGGVDGAIHRAAGPELMRELDTIRAQVGRCPTGSAVVTGAGKLPARYVFHTVGPVYRSGDEKEAELLRSCYIRCLDLAAQNQLSSISFPSISTGVYGSRWRRRQESPSTPARVAGDANLGPIGETGAIQPCGP